MRFAILVTVSVVGLAACGDDGAATTDVVADTCGSGATMTAPFASDVPPVWDTANPGQVVIVEGHPFSFTQTATGPDGDAFTYLLKQRADETMAVNSETGEITWTPGFDTVTSCRDSRVFTIVITARAPRPCGEFVDVDRHISIKVLNDLDEDGVSDVGANNEPLDDDIDGDGVNNADEATAGTDPCVPEPASR